MARRAAMRWPRILSRRGAPPPDLSRTGHSSTYPRHSTVQGTGMKIAVVGAGYVGLVSGACLADFGYAGALLYPDLDRVAALEAGHVPIYEAGLEAILLAGRRVGRLRFTSNLK